jgi:uncharacterized lipoprotein YddW (UPF0748 family)
MRLRLRARLLVLAATCGLLPTLQAAEPELRGTWVTTTGNDAIATPAKTAETMRRLREIGLNTVYVECWKNGYTEFPSATLKKTIGVEMKVNGKDAPQRDLLAEATTEAHRNGLLCVAWFEYGFMAAFKDTHNELRAKKEWLTTMRDGSDVSKKNGFVWLNPFHPEVQQFLIDISVEAVEKYDLDGVQLDDRIALPVDLGYDDYTRGLYKKETGRDVPDDANDAAWKRWRADKISEYSLRYVSALRTANPELILSVSPAPFPWSYENYLCDWAAWTRWCNCGGKRWDEYVPQTYRMDGAATIKNVGEQIAHVGEQVSSLAAGIRVVGDGPDMKWDDVRKSVEFTREQKTLGLVLWFSRGVLDVYPKEFAAFYDVAKNGPAANPQKTVGWRPLPIVATRAADGAWRARVETPGSYQVIARRGDAWHVVRTIDAKAGEVTVDADGEAVELLVDRRR